ncbi:MAG TPA: glucose 1-dehydrogenase [Planctomycetaceae bacterium]|nr:glucose 1-dehydrogenase [Planctomycetaceae bacterium]
MPDDLFSVAGHVTLLSGASRGIGRALAAGFSERGAKVVITGREAASLERTAHEISTADNAVLPIVCDVSQTEATSRLVAQVLEEFGRIDTLVNVAGVNKRKKVETFSADEYDFILNVNLRGLFFLSQEVGKAMIAQKGGAIINIDSVNTNSPLKGVLPYAISKAGVSMMTRGMAAEWGEYGVRVNAIAPGFILTDLTSKLWSNPTMQKWGHANTPLKRLGQVEDLVGTAIYLASGASAFVTGQVLYVDGGLSAGTLWPIEL